MKIYLVRHGIPESELAASRTGRGDAERRLTEEGKKECRRMAAFLREKIESIPVILHSPYVRARETAEIFATAMPKARLVEEPGITPNDDARVAAEALGAWAKEGEILVVSHEPFLGTLLSYLLTGGFRMASPFERGAVASLEGLPPGHCRLEFLLTPRTLPDLT